MMDARKSRTGSSRARRARAGFTLIELMVALVAAGIALGSIYYVSSASARHFHEQQRVAQTQTAVRLAIEQIRRDFTRAGFLGTPNTAVERTCRAAPFRVAAIDSFTDSDPAGIGALPNAGANLVTADRIVLTGNYSTSDGYLASGLDSSGSRIFLQREWQAFRRSFGVPFNAASFGEVFVPGRLLHIRNQQGNHFFVTITGADAPSASITFQPGLGVGGLCVVGLLDGALVAPLSRIEYRVMDMAALGADGSSLAPLAGPEAQDFRGVTNSVLVRRELQFGNNNPIPGTTRPVLEYVADFNLSFVVDQQVTPGAPANLVLLDGAAAAAAVNGNPHRVRNVVVRLSARTPEQDVRFPFVQRNAGEPLTRYQVNPAVPGAARVRTLRAELILPNLTNRVIRP